MLVSVAWLRRHVNLAGVEIAWLLNKFTLHVAEIEGSRTFVTHERIVTGRIEGVEPLPGERLNVWVVSIGASLVRIVSAAKGLASGQCVAVGLPGAIVSGREVAPREVKNEVSEAVLISERDLGLSDDEERLLLVDEGSPLGVPVSQLAPLDDTVFEVDNKAITHRPDLWGHRGIAREVAALCGRQLLSQPAPDLLSGLNPVRISVGVPDVCPRYCALTLSNLSIRPSPLWLRTLLQRVGLRALNNIVDASNFVMLDSGNPVHCFDRNKLKGTTIFVRRANPGEAIGLIDGSDRSLEPSDIVVADADGPIALAGVMGGSESSVSAATLEVLLEAATFDPASIRRTASRLALRTEASARFEKDLDPCLPEQACGSFVDLVQQLVPTARIGAGLSTCGRSLPESRVVRLRIDAVDTRLGISLGKDRIRDYLERLCFRLEECDEGFDVTVPSFRATKDIREEIDLIEEIGRSHGYDNIPPRPALVALQRPPENLRKHFERAARSYLTSACGLDEQITYSFASAPFMAKLGDAAPPPFRLKNPISSEMPGLRSALVPGLLLAVQRNAREDSEIGFFEIGRVFPGAVNAEGFPQQPTRLAIVIASEALSEVAAEGFFRIKKYVRGLSVALKRAQFEWVQGGLSMPWAHPARQSRLAVDGVDVGYAAELHPTVAERLSITQRVAFCELDLESYRTTPPDVVSRIRVPRFPPVTRDFAVVVDETTSAERVRKAIVGASDYIEDVRFRSVYRGEGLPPSSKSLAWTVTLRHDERTLSETEVRHSEDRIWSELASHVSGRPR